MKNQDTDAKLAKLREENDRLRNEIHNLKRKVKRMEERKADSEKLRQERCNEVKQEGIEDIKKKLVAAGMPERAADVADWVISGATGFKKK